MSAYQNFVADFPARCGDVLELAFELAETKDREVTLLLMTAAAAFLVPFERLRGGMSTEHPAQDRRQFSQLAQQLDSAMGGPFLGSPFCDDVPGSWHVGNFVSPDWCTYIPVTNKTPASQVFATIRNALAHGNLGTLISDKSNSNGVRGEKMVTPAGSNYPIEALVFTSEDRRNGGLKYVRVSPADFRAFLENWFAFLKAGGIKPADVAEVLDKVLAAD